MTRLSDLNTELDRLAPALARSTDIQTLVNRGRRLRAEALADLAKQGFAMVGRTARGTGRRTASIALAGSFLARAWRRRRTVKQLQSLSDRMLDDIGLRRDQIDGVATMLAARPVAGAPHSSTSIARTLLAKARRSRLRRATIRELEQLSDRVLSDIGMSRGQIPAAVERILEKQSAQAPVAPTGDSPVHELLSGLEGAVRPLRQWHLSRLAAGQIARLGNATLADLGYVKGDVDWVPEVMAKRKIANPQQRPRAGAA